LLGAFLSRRDESAFEALVRRHGPMVLGVCRRVLGDLDEVEDAFQATFLVLARQAASIRGREAVGNWLYGVAYRTALHAHRVRFRRQAREKQVKDMPHPQVVPDDQWQELQSLLDQELSGLPDKYRLPVVLCDLEGRARKDVARQLRIPEGTLSNRLSTARKMLARRLRRHGLTLPAGAVATFLSQARASAFVSAQLLGPTVQAATLLAARQTAAAIVSPRVLTLMEGTVRSMLLTKLKTVFSLVLVVGLLGLGSGPLTHLTATGQPATVINQSDPVLRQAPGEAEPAPAILGTGDKGGSQFKKQQQQIEDALEKLTTAKDQISEKKAWVELQQAVAGMKDALHQKWGLPKQGKPAKEAPPPKVTAEKLAAAFLTNEAEADVQYADKVIEVTGTIVKIFRAPKGFESEKGVPDYLVEVLSSEKNPAEVPLQFLFAERDKKELAGLKPKQTISIQAYCRGLVPGTITGEGLKKGQSIHFWAAKVVTGEK
jgi:RNA polymerase sigma factor (sigma-70 family)